VIAFVWDAMREDRVLRHRARGFDVRLAEGLVMHDASAARDERDDAGDAAVVDVALHPGAQALEPLGRDADGLGRGRGRRLGSQQGSEREEEKNGKDREQAHHGASLKPGSGAHPTPRRPAAAERPVAGRLTLG